MSRFLDMMDATDRAIERERIGELLDAIEEEWEDEEVCHHGYDVDECPYCTVDEGSSDDLHGDGRGGLR